VNSVVCSNYTLFTKRLPTFTMVNLFNFTQNLIKHQVNLDTYSCHGYAYYDLSLMSKNVNDYYMYFNMNVML